LEKAMSSLAARLRAWFAAQAEKQSLLRLGDQEVGRIAKDAGIGVNELYQLNRLGPRNADLLPLRMEAEGLDPSDVRDRRPALMRDMQRVCTFCQRHGTCAREVASPIASERWKTYCPNAATIQALTTEETETV
jgi:hypothetical protein